MILTHDISRSIALSTHASARPLWAYRYGETPKPHVASLCTPCGQELALLEPVDHTWHRGLWFAIKYVNGDNFWEEREPFGRQRTVGVPAVEATGDRITVTTRIDWIAPDGSTPVREERMLACSLLGPAWILDWTSTIVANIDIELDRTPYTTWGGYGGLSFRGSRHWHPKRYLIPGAEHAPFPAGLGATWIDLSGEFDGEGTPSGGIAIIDRNAEEVPWYGGGDASMNFLNAAFLFHGPQLLPAGASRTLAYRVAIHDGMWTSADVEAIR